MPSFNFVLHVHQPFRLTKEYKPGRELFSSLNKEVLLKCANKSYIPTTNILLDNMDKLKDFKVGFSMSGVFLEQCEKYAPDVLDNFKQICEKGRAEVLTETYYHSLSSLHPDFDEFEEQVKEHQQVIKDLLSPKAVGSVFRNTELIYDNRIGKKLGEMGFKGVFTEGTEKILQWRSPHYLYSNPDNNIKLLLRNYRLSDDIGYRFSSAWWEQWPLSAEKYAKWINDSEGDVVNVYIDFETFGEHHWEDSGIFHFLKALPWMINKESNTSFILPSEAVEKFKTVGTVDVPFAISWADMERDVSAWLGNKMQHEMFNKIISLRNQVSDKKLYKYLTTSDHLYYICNKWWQEGDVHKYFSYYDSPEQAYHNLGRALNWLKKK